MRAGAALLVDEAHALGVVGAGRARRGRRGGARRGAGRGADRDAVEGAGQPGRRGARDRLAVIDHLIDSARTFIFDTGLAPASAGSAFAALRLLQAEPQRAQRVREIATRVAVALGAPLPAAAVVSVVLGEPERAVAAAAGLRA